MSSRGPVVPTLLYVYGFAECAPRQRRIAGAGFSVEEGVPVEWLRHGDMGAIVSRVSAREYDEDPLAVRLQDPSWLVPRAERHVGVLVEQLGTLAVAPGRFGTIYRDRAGVLAFIDRHREPLRAILKRVRDSAEWAVKAYVSAHRVEEASSCGGGARPGTAYFQGLLRRRANQREAEAYALGNVDRIRARIRRFSAQVVELPLRETKPSTQGRLLLNLSCLVPLSETPRFRASLARLAMSERRRGVEFASTGPWPPFGFVADLLPARELDMERVP